MANRHPYPRTDDGGVEPISDRPPPTPRWVKVFGIVGIVLVLLLVVMLLTGHGPGRHMGSSHALPPGVAEHGLQPS